MIQQIEMIVATYGGVYSTFDTVMLNRSAAEKYAAELVGHTINDYTGKATNLSPAKQYRIISTRLEDDPANSLQGKVIAVCQEIQRTGPSEVK